MIKNYQFLVSSLLFAWSLAVSAQPQGVENRYSDHPLLAGFADSEIIQVEYSEDVNYRFVLGALQRSGGEVVPEESERLRGDVTRITYEISQEFNGEDVHKYYQEQIQQKSYVELFSCQGRACGSSNYWANDVFSNRILYGPERNQFYIALNTDSATEDLAHIALYIITRGNRRLYAHVEIVETQGQQPTVEVVPTTTEVFDFSQQSNAILGGITFNDSDQLIASEGLAQLAATLVQNESMSIYIVAHLGTRSGTELDTLLIRSRLRAERVRDALISLGIEGGRVNAQGVGPLAPACPLNNCAQRIEVVVQ